MELIFLSASMKEIEKLESKNDMEILILTIPNLIFKTQCKTLLDL
jgi:hypothetical protein